MEARERQAIKSEILNGFQNLSKDNQRVIVRLADWILANKPNPEEMAEETARIRESITI